MTAWAVVCDVWYLEPQTRKKDESATMFAERVKQLIAKRAGLTALPWDGYLKHYQPKKSFMEERQHIIAQSLCLRFGLKMNNPESEPKIPSDSNISLVPDPVTDHR
jgi:glycerol-3-phosphate O-acyltransferase 3/4